MTDRQKPWEAIAERPSDTTIVDVLRLFRSAGFGASFAAKTDAEIWCSVCDERSPAAQFEIRALRRLEGASDPDDMVAVYAAVCPRCLAHGSLVIGYGPSTSSEDSDVLAAVDADTAGLPPVPEHHPVRSGPTSTESHEE